MSTSKQGFLSAFSSRRVWLMVGLGFASGLPNPLTGSTLTAWMRTEGVDLSVIGLFALIHLPYNLKFLWAPFLDRYRIPFLGRRRGWMLLSQILVLIAIGVMGSIDPKSSLGLLAIAGLALASLSATQDVVTDAYRTDVLPAHQRGSGTAIFVAGFRAALIVASAGALVLADYASWTVVYWVLASIMVLGMFTTLVAPNPVQEEAPPKALWKAFVEPLSEFFGRRRAVVILSVVLLYKVGDAIAAHMRNPFLLDQGYTLTEIGAIVKGLGLAASILGALVGGGMIARWGLFRAMVIFGILQAAANLFYIAVAVMDKSNHLLVAAISVDELFNGLGTAAFVAYLMSLCHPRFTAVQYALLSASGTVVKSFISAVGGFIAEWADWPAFFIITVVVALPAIALLFVAPRPDQRLVDSDTGGG